jgi:hypothetical protein
VKRHLLRVHRRFLRAYRGATLNYMLDGYYEYNFNQPPGRANDVRACDVLSNVFSINQAEVIFALDPDFTARRRYGVRLDLQFGQATETLQGNPGNEPRPDFYRNGTYVLPVGKGLNIDFGKWAAMTAVSTSGLPMMRSAILSSI